MPVDAHRFIAEVFDRDGRRLGEARLWGSADRTAEGATWRGWLRVADLENAELPTGPLALRLADGSEASCELIGRRLSRFGEQDLAPIEGGGDPPWSEEAAPARYRPVWNETPPRLADDRPALNRLAGVVTAIPELIATELATAPYLTTGGQERVDRLRRERSLDRAADAGSAPDLIAAAPAAHEHPPAGIIEPNGSVEMSDTAEPASGVIGPDAAGEMSNSTTDDLPKSSASIESDSPTSEGW